MAREPKLKADAWTTKLEGAEGWRGFIGRLSGVHPGCRDVAWMAPKIRQTRGEALQDARDYLRDNRAALA